MRDGRIGRFGWKASIPSLREFVLLACTIELGLELPDEHQPRSPVRAEKQAKGHDMTAGECEASCNMFGSCRR